MRATTTTPPTGRPRPRGEHPAAASSYGRLARARHAIQQLAPETIEQIARRVAELLRQTPLAAPAGDADADGEPDGLLTASQLAERLGVSRTWVYEHARKLGAISLGDGPRARLRFDLDTAMQALNATPTPELVPTPAKHRQRRRTPESTVPLLPVKSYGRRGLFTRLGLHRSVRSR